MLVALAIMHRSQRVDRKVFWQFLERMPEQQVVDQGVGGQWQVVPVLLDGRRGQNHQGPVARQRIDLLPGEVGKETLGGDPGLQGSG